MPNIDSLVSERLMPRLTLVRGVSLYDITLRRAYERTRNESDHHADSCAEAGNLSANSRFLMCKGDLQCSHRPLGRDLISPAPELCMMIISSLGSAKYNQHSYFGLCVCVFFLLIIQRSFFDVIFHL